MGSLIQRTLVFFALGGASFFPFALSSRAATVDVSSLENIRPALPEIPGRSFFLLDFGAMGDGKTLNTEAFKRAIAAVEKAGGGQLIVPAGVFRTTSFTLCSSLDLHLVKGAIIQAPNTFNEFGLPDPSTLHSQAEIDAEVKTPPPLITGNNLHDVALTGEGIIDGNGALWWAWSERASRAQPGRLIYKRPHLIAISGCKRLHVADLTLTNSPMFHLVPRDITDLTIERVKVRAPFDAPNTDAIDPGPVTNGLIRDCDIDTGDDDIVIKTGATNVLIENCMIKHGHGLSIGSNTTGGVQNLLVRHCMLNGTDNGIRIKSMRGAGGLVENVRYTDIQMQGVTNAIVLELNYVDNNRPDFKGDPTKIPAIHNISIDHLTIENSKNAGHIIGLPDSLITGITLSDMHITAETDLVITDADHPILENVTSEIKKGIAPHVPKTME